MHLVSDCLYDPQDVIEKEKVRLFLQMFQVESKSSAIYGVDTGFAVSKIGLHTLNCRFNVHPSAVVCSHLFVSIHLHGLMITNHIFTFYTSSLQVQLQLWPGRASHNSARAATQTAKSSPKFFRDSFCRSSCFHRLEETRKTESVCNRWRQAVEREQELRGNTPVEKET